MRTLAALLMAVAISACATASPSHPAERRAFRFDVLTAEEISTTPYRDLLSAVQALRPTFLHARDSRGISEIVTYVDGVRVRGSGFLSAVAVESVAEVRRLNAIDATTRYGVGHSSGAILITTRRGMPSR